MIVVDEIKKQLSECGINIIDTDANYNETISTPVGPITLDQMVVGTYDLREDTPDIEKELQEPIIFAAAQFLRDFVFLRVQLSKPVISVTDAGVIGSSHKKGYYKGLTYPSTNRIDKSIIKIGNDYYGVFSQYSDEIHLDRPLVNDVNIGDPVSTCLIGDTNYDGLGLYKVDLSRAYLAIAPGKMTKGYSGLRQTVSVMIQIAAGVVCKV